MHKVKKTVSVREIAPILNQPNGFEHTMETCMNTSAESKQDEAREISSREKALFISPSFKKARIQKTYLSPINHTKQIALTKTALPDEPEEGIEGKAMASFLSGMIGIVLTYYVFAVAGFIFGILALFYGIKAFIRISKNHKNGSVLAGLGILLGIIGILFALFVLALFY